MLQFLYTISLGLVCFVIWLVLKNKKLKEQNNVLENSKENDEKEDLNPTFVQQNTKQAEMERLSIVAKQTDNAIMIMDPEGNIQWLNDGFTRMYEYTFDQFIKIRGNNILQTSFNPLVQKCIEQCLETKKPSSYEAINVTPSGREIWTHTSLSPVLDENGEIIHLVTVDSDISRRKEAGDALIQRVDKLTRKISDLSQQQMDLTNFTNRLMHEVGRSNEKIGETDQIVNFIQEMSDKIKIMGINASIEAQYVGEKGSGFKVISSEIVQMSDETKRYSKEISNIVRHIQNSSEQLNSGKELVEEASVKYQQAVDALKLEVRLVEDVVERLN
ncbi:methyl-accepting chemotaxis protein [Plebeiibacterium marinum]|uniref:PAS domain-containing protein n=1 Tax=Plebeiibacterium marinum TaxID=2992111 RepID=A0AAE3MCG7_9BACT|nr:PAS domain-containing protein [Plebeiobacterium marinum]MCW3804916.1 PAS domain-containing protein [Plebeiobacterium marinum]